MNGHRNDIANGPSRNRSTEKKRRSSHDDDWLNSPLSDSTRLTYNDLARYPPQHALQETFQPKIHAAIRRPNVRVRSTRAPPVELMRAHGATQAYALIPGKDPIDLSHHGENWGCVYFAAIYQVVVSTGNHVYFEPPAQDRPECLVAIKKLNKEAIRVYLNGGGQENPYKEIYRMQQLGDNIHVLKCIEALEDDEFLYIITPKAVQNLAQAIPWNPRNSQTMEPDRVRAIFRQILNIMLYLERHGICHRDLSPDNFLFLPDGNLVVFDFALSQRIPIGTTDSGRQQRALIYPQGNFGTRAYMAPEIFANTIYDGVGSDLWSVSVILYNLLTCQILYHLPHPTDINFRYYILAEGLSSRPVNERTIEVLMDYYKPGKEQEAQRDLMSRAMAHLSLGPAVVDLLEKLLSMNPALRWSLGRVCECDYVNGEGGDEKMNDL